MQNHNYEMATPINTLNSQPSNINNLVKNVENNIETLNNSGSYQPQNLTYNPRIEPNNNQYQQQNIPNFQQPPVNMVQPVKRIQDEKPVVEEKKPFFKSLLVNSKEYLIMVLLFSLLAHKKISKIFYNFVPGLNTFESPLPSLILRGLIFAICLFIIKTFI